MAEPGTAGEQIAESRRSRGYLVVLLGMTVVVLVLIVLGMIVGWRVLQADVEQARRDAVLHTARLAADNLTTIDYRT
ncbi:MAG: hypothetical protein ACRDTT_13480, partial [Pseudonocardiaceae bacterium]